ncbi:MAG: hypothetical protein FWE85_00160 [Clostridiales bacterium]|nr:hypothetical protein [Clostridiales bacterium]
MKDYNDYMDGISAGHELHEKIMERAGRGAKPDAPRRKRPFLRYAGAVACAVLVIFCVWLFPNLPGEPGKNDPEACLLCGGNACVCSPGAPDEPVQSTPPLGPGENGDRPLEWWEIPLFLNSFEELARAKEKNYFETYYPVYSSKYYGLYLENLNFYYIPVYAVSHYNLYGVTLSSGGIASSFSKSTAPWLEDVPWKDRFTLTSYHAEPEYMVRRIKSGELKPWISGTIYYQEFNSFSGSRTLFYWVQDGDTFSLNISTELLNEIKKNDPGALEGPLFELQRVDLE